MNPFDLDLIRQTIEAIEPTNEFINNELGWCDICQWCHNIISSEHGVSVEGHDPDCLRQKALTLVKSMDKPDPEPRKQSPFWDFMDREGFPP